MTLFNIALKNIKRNFYNYYLYFISMIFSIMIYFTFTLIEYNEQVIKLTGSNDIISFAFKASAVIVALFSTIFIWYSNSFFTRKRKKEIALYSLLGVKKRKIARMLFYENIAMGTIALITGILIGSLLSKVFIMLLVKLMGIIVPIKFVLIPKAVSKTCIVFFIIFLITSIHEYRIIYKFKLIELFKAENKGEREPKGVAICALLSIIFIVSGYSIYILGTNYNPLSPLIALILIIIGTYLFFSSFLTFLIKIAKKNKKRYYNGINLISTSQFLYRIKANSRTLATITILSAVTLTFMGMTSSLYYDFQSKLSTNYPFTYVFRIKGEDSSFESKIKNTISKYPKNNILNSFSFQIIKTKGTIPYIYKYKEPVYNKENICLISESNFNKIAQINGYEKVNLKHSNEIILINEYFEKFSMKSIKGKYIDIDSSNRFKVADIKTKPIVNKGIFHEIVLVMQDKVYNNFYSKENISTIFSYNTNNKSDSEALTKDFYKLVSDYEIYDTTNNITNIFFSSYYDYYTNMLMSYGLTIFISSFLGLVLLTATGSIIFFKQLSEANEDKEKYKILRNIGISKKEIKASISKQILFIFLLPLIIGIFHSLVAVSIMSPLLNQNLTVPISISVSAYTIIYMIYYVITVNTYNNIVNSP